MLKKTEKSKFVSSNDATCGFICLQNLFFLGLTLIMEFCYHVIGCILVSLFFFRCSVDFDDLQNTGNAVAVWQYFAYKLQIMDRQWLEHKIFVCKNGGLVVRWLVQSFCQCAIHSADGWQHWLTCLHHHVHFVRWFFQVFLHWRPSLILMVWQCDACKQTKH